MVKLTFQIIYREPDSYCGTEEWYILIYKTKFFGLIKQIYIFVTDRINIELWNDND